MSEQVKVMKPRDLTLICDADGCGFTGGTETSDDIEWCREAKCPKCGTPFLTVEDFNALRGLAKQTIAVSGVPVPFDRLEIRTDGNGGLTASIRAKGEQL